MGSGIIIEAYASLNSPIFQKHMKAAYFCVGEGLSLPAETSEFFRGNVAGGNFEDVEPKVALNYIKNGLSMDFDVHAGDVDEGVDEYHFQVSDIPDGVDRIVVKRVQ